MLKLKAGCNKVQGASCNNGTFNLDFKSIREKNMPRSNARSNFNASTKFF